MQQVHDIDEAVGARSRRIGSLVAGLALGLGIFYFASVTIGVWLSSQGEAIWPTVIVVFLGAGCVLVGANRPFVGVVAGSVVLALVLISVLVGTANAWAHSRGWLDLLAIWGQGAGSPSTALLGAVLVCSAIAPRLLRR